MKDPNCYGMRVDKKKLIGISTIDKTNDAGFLDRARIVTNLMHKTNQDAVKNITIPSVIPVAILGHGDNGVIGTGNGTSLCLKDKDKFIGLSNIDVWKSLFAGLKNRVKNLYLLGCNCGTGKAGAQLLFELAKLINAPVAAPTGFICCDDNFFSLEHGSTWQVSSALQIPQSIEEPPVVIGPSMKMITIYTSSGPIELLKSAIISIIPIKPFQFSQRKEVKDEAIEKLLAMIDLLKPIDLPGHPASIIDGTFSIEYTYQNGHYKKEYNVLNGRLIQDKQFPLKAYYCKKTILDYFE